MPYMFEKMFSIDFSYGDIVLFSRYKLYGQKAPGTFQIISNVIYLKIKFEKLDIKELFYILPFAVKLVSL